MILYILRHAIAKDRARWTKADADRPLTAEGIRKFKKCTRGLKELGITFDVILSSPYRRAYDTATLVAKAYKCAEPRILKSLASDGDPQALIRYLTQNHRSWERLLIVGHEPYLSRLIGTLIAGDARAGIELKKGGLCSLESDALSYGKSATCRFLLTPRQLRSLS